LTNEQLEAFVDDPNEYVAEEDEELSVAQSYSVRTSAIRLTIDLASLFVDASACGDQGANFGVRSVLGAVEKRSQEVLAMQEAGHEQWYVNGTTNRRAR
jgi:hypothetical protein